MADAGFDVIIIGGGHNGLTAACYLAKAGMSVAVFERQHELGGGACSEEIPLPGFLSNPCANFHGLYTSPVWGDFKLWEVGAWYNMPQAATVVFFDDDRCLVTYPAVETVDLAPVKNEFRPENLEKTLKEISRFSPRDAETAHICWGKYQGKWAEAFREWRLNPPHPWGEKDALERLLDDPENGMDPRYGVMTLKEVAYDVWESPEMRIGFMRSILSSSGIFPDDVIPIGEIIKGFQLICGFSTYGSVVGGSHSLAHALQRRLSQMGGQFFVHNEVDKILIENGQAKGIRLVDGTEVTAKKLVVSNVDPEQTMLRFVGEEHVSRQLANRVRNFSFDRANLFWMHFACHELPKWRAAEWNPDCSKTNRYYCCPNDLDYYVDRHQMEIFLYGIPKKLFLLGGPDSIWDKSRAPEGKHNIAVEQFAAPTRYFTESEWLRMKRDIVNEVLKEWQRYAPNMNEDNLIAAYVNTPYDVQNRNINMHEGSWTFGAMTVSQVGRFRPCPELASYRTPIKNLYMSGACMHYGGGLRGICGYNCYKTITEDFGLPKIWEEKGRPY